MNAIELIRAIKTEQEAEAAAKATESQTKEARCVEHFKPVLNFFKQIEHLDAKSYRHNAYNRMPLRAHARTISGSHITFWSGTGNDGHILNCRLDTIGQPQIYESHPRAVSSDRLYTEITPDQAIYFLCEYAITQDVKLP